jgi:hypothetical protein
MTSSSRNGLFGESNQAIDLSNASVTVRLYYERYQEDKKLLLNDKNECIKIFEDFLRSEDTRKIYQFRKDPNQYDANSFFSYKQKLHGISESLQHSHPNYFQKLNSIADSIYTEQHTLLKFSGLNIFITKLELGPNEIRRNHVNRENQLFLEFMKNVKLAEKESKPAATYTLCTLL